MKKKIIITLSLIFAFFVAAYVLYAYNHLNFEEGHTPLTITKSLVYDSELNQTYEYEPIVITDAEEIAYIIDQLEWVRYTYIYREAFYSTRYTIYYDGHLIKFNADSDRNLEYFYVDRKLCHMHGGNFDFIFYYEFELVE